MRRFSLLFPVLTLLLFAAALVRPAGAADRVLQPGVPFNTSLPAQTFATDLYVEVPVGAVGLTVAITGASADFDLYVKQGSPIMGTAVEDWDADTGFLADGPSGNESITVTPSSSPPLSAGRWYIGTLNWAKSTASFTITATVQAGAPGVSISTVSVDFGQVSAGSTALRSVSLENYGAGTLTIQSMLISGPDKDEFEVTADCASVAPAQTCEIQITFIPSGSGTKSAFLQIASNAPASPTVTLSLSGTAVSGGTAEPMPVPRGQEVFSYRILQPALRSAFAATARPVRVGSCSPGTEGLDLGLVMGAFTAPVDVYVGAYAPDLDPATVFVLRPDGLFQSLTAGLVPWKSGLSAAIEETFLAGINTAQLPDGDYGILVMVTPAGRLDAFYLWQAVLTVPGVCAPAPVSEGSAGYVRGEVVIPGGTIVVRGEEHDGSVVVSGNALVGLVKNGKGYLYHPALGHTKLTEETSRLAVGYFLAGTEVGPGTEARAVSASKAIAPGGSIHLSTGLALSHPKADTLSVSNLYGRWAAVRDAEEAFFGPTTYFLGPRGSLLPTNVPEVIERAWTENYLGVYTRNIPYSAPMTLQTYGSVFRSLPIILLGQGLEGFDQACKNDPRLFARVNLVDAIQFLGDGFQHLFAVVGPEECTEGLINDVAIEAVKQLFIFLATVEQSGHDGALWEKPAVIAFKTWAFNALQGLAKCAGIAGTTLVLPPAGVAAQVAAQFIDIVAGIKWIAVDTLFGFSQLVFNTTAYDEVTIADLAISKCQATGNLKINEDGQMSFSCTALGADRVTVDFGGVAGEPSHTLASDPASKTWSATATVHPVLAGTRTATFTAWNSSGQYKRCEASIEVAGSFSIRECSLTPLDGELFAGRYSEVALSCTVDGASTGNVTADLSALGGQRQVFLSRGENGTWSTQNGVNPDAPGHFTVIFSANDAGESATYELTVTVNDPNEQSSISFTDPTGAWTVTLTFPQGQRGWAEVVADPKAYNTDQVVKVFLDGMPTNPYAWDRIPVLISVAHPNLRSWILETNQDITDPTLSHFITSTTSDPVSLWAQSYYWMNLYQNSGPYSSVIFRLYGTL